MRTTLDRLLSLGAALVAVALLLVAYPIAPTPLAADPVPAAVAWPHALRVTVDAVLADKTVYQPGIFLDARTSVGTAPDPTHRWLRLVVRGADGSIRQLQHLPLAQTPWFGGFTVAGDVLAWAESTAGGNPLLWTVNLLDGRPARSLTADTADAVLAGSPYDLVVAASRLYWAATDPQQRNVTQIRSVALTGGPVDIRTEPGAWQLSAWPWLVNGRGDPDGTTMLRNLTTNRDLAVPGAVRSTTRCSPTWCRVASLSGGGYRVELMHPDGSAREPVADGTALPAILDVAILDRFEVLWQVGSYSDLTGTRQLLIFDLATRQTVQASPDARTVANSGGMVWWSTGTQDSPVWHTLDLHTV